MASSYLPLPGIIRIPGATGSLRRSPGGERLMQTASERGLRLFDGTAHGREALGLLIPALVEVGAIIVVGEHFPLELSGRYRTRLYRGTPATGFPIEASEVEAFLDWTEEEFCVQSTELAGLRIVNGVR
jgi:hypothetical protein